MTNSSTRSVSDRLLDARIVMLADEVSDESAHRLISELLALSADDPESDICLFINSPGGSVLTGVASLNDVLPRRVVRRVGLTSASEPGSAA